MTTLTQELEQQRIKYSDYEAYFNKMAKLVADWTKKYPDKPCPIKIIDRRDWDKRR